MDRLRHASDGLLTFSCACTALSLNSLSLPFDVLLLNGLGAGPGRPRPKPGRRQIHPLFREIKEGASVGDPPPRAVVLSLVGMARRE